VFPTLFWKWISDTWEHEHAEALEVYGDDLNDEVEADYHRFVMPPECLWSQVVTKTDNIGVRISRALGKIAQTNPNDLAGVFGDAAWGNKERLPSQPSSPFSTASAASASTPTRSPTTPWATPTSIC